MEDDDDDDDDDVVVKDTADTTKIDLFFDKNKKVSNTKIKKLYKEIEKLKKELKLLKSTNTNKKDIIVLKADLDIYNTTFNKNNIKKSKHVCWWCYHKFDTIPIGITEKMIKNRFYIYGNFPSILFFLH